MPMKPEPSGPRITLPTPPRAQRKVLVGRLHLRMAPNGALIVMDHIKYPNQDDPSHLDTDQPSSSAQTSDSDQKLN